MPAWLFSDRRHAGRRLGEALAASLSGTPIIDAPIAIVLGLPRGGVVVAAEVARVLRAPLDVIVVRKLGLPAQPELAFGAIGEGGTMVMNDDVVRITGIGAADIERVRAREAAEVARRVERIRRRRTREPLAGRTAVIVDDGIATGATVRAAVGVARAHGAATVVVATPVAPGDVVASLATLADRVVCLEQPDPFRAVGSWYEHFDEVSDDEVLALVAPDVTSG